MRKVWDVCSKKDDLDDEDEGGGRATLAEGEVMKAGSLSLPSTTMHPYMEGLLPTAPSPHVRDLTTR